MQLPLAAAVVLRATSPIQGNVATGGRGAYLYNKYTEGSGDVVGVLTMADVSRDQFALIRIEGMHCHKCETAVQRALSANPGVREVEVDFPSKQASVLFDREAVSMKQLLESVNKAGYHAAGFSVG